MYHCLNLIEKGYIPLDKSWIIRMGILDLFNNYDDIDEFLGQQKELCDDLKALQKALINWKSGNSIYVGESGTLYRFLKFASWKSNLNKKFILSGSLLKRKICDDPKIRNYPLEKLLKLDNGTSQWASAAVLLGNKEKILHPVKSPRSGELAKGKLFNRVNPPYKLKITYEAISHWEKQRAKRLSWQPRYDETILRQAETFLKLLKGEKISFIPQQAEDYCFSRALGFMTKEEGESRWPSLLGHESNRIEEMEKMINNSDQKIEIDSTDHRVIQAIAMRQKIKNKPIKFLYPLSVNKSWTQFWKFLNDSARL